MTSGRKLLSVVIPLLNEEENLRSVHERLAGVAATLDRDVEFIFVDDGSTDGSFRVLTEIALQDPRVRILKLARNFGSHGACLAGFSFARGDHVVIQTADLQDPPELLPVLLERADAGHDVVWGSRERRADPLLTTVLSRLYNRLMRRVALPNWPMDGFDFVLVSRAVLSSLLSRQERNTSIFGQILWSGFSQTSVPYERVARRSGRSKWTFSKKIKLAIDSFVSFSYVPIRLISAIGILFAFAGLLYAVLVVAMRIIHGVAIQGWASLMVVLMVIGGTQLVMLGVIGEYLWRTLEQARGRPSFIVAEAKEFGRDGRAVSLRPNVVAATQHAVS